MSADGLSWPETAKRQDAADDLADARRFIAGQTVVARMIGKAGFDVGAGESVRARIATCALSSDAEMAIVVRREYRAFLRDLPPVPASQAFEMMACFYQRIAFVLEAQGERR